MKIKRLYEIIRLISIVPALILTSCTETEDIVNVNEGSVIYPSLSVGVSEMSMTATSRAESPMSPDHEKYVRTMALFEFDNEGLHECRSTSYHFIDFINGTIDGKREPANLDSTEYGIVETTLNGLAFEARTEGTLCLVANVTEDQVDELYDKHREEGQTYGRLTIDTFKRWAMPFDYVKSTSDVYDESTTGYLETMYMFGYFEGEIKPAEIGNIRVDLGRLASRLDITVVNETGSDITERLGYHFDNVCQSAYFFPILSGMPPTSDKGLARTVICAGDQPVEGDDNTFKIVPSTFPNNHLHTRYFYVAAHSAKGYADATKLHLFYNRTIPEKDNTDGNEPSSYVVPLCNVEPYHAADISNGYSLSRNTRYHFTIRLKNRYAAQNEEATRTGAATVEYGEQPGEITIYLPIDE